MTTTEVWPVRTVSGTYRASCTTGHEDEDGYCVRCDRYSLSSLSSFIPRHRADVAVTA